MGDNKYQIENSHGKISFELDGIYIGLGTATEIVLHRPLMIAARENKTLMARLHVKESNVPISKLDSIMDEEPIVELIKESFNKLSNSMYSFMGMCVDISDQRATLKNYDIFWQG